MGVERSEPIPIPAPYGGMNTRDGLATLQPFEARVLRNLIPAGNAVVPRLGHAAFSTGVAGSIPSLYAYEGLTKTELIGIGNDDLYNFTASSAVQIANSNYTVNDYFIMENYGNRLIGVAEGQTPFTYDGTSSAATGFTGSGLTLSNLSNIAKVHNRLWFCEKNSSDVWYGPLGGITGTLTKFQLSQIAAGGICMAIGSHSQDAGDGPDDFTVFVMSTGETIIYSGDPSSTFTKVGNFRMPPPVGRRCLVNIGGQLAVLTNMGLVPVTAAMSGIAMDALAIGPFGKIAPTLSALVKQFGSSVGWHMVYFNGAVIINIPTAADASLQAHYTVATGAWTILEGLPILSMAVMGNNLYFGHFTNGIVYKYTGFLDIEDAISIKARGAFQDTGAHSAVASMIKFDVRVGGSLQGKFGVDVDFKTGSLAGLPTEEIGGVSATTPWGSPWGSPWSSFDEGDQLWFSTLGEGNQFAIALEASVTAEVCEWYRTQVLFEQARRAL